MIDHMGPGKGGPDWRVLLIGGHSASGKTIASKRLGLALGVPWMQVDDIRLAFQRARARLPEHTDALYFDNTPNFLRPPPEEQCDALVAVGEVLSTPLEVIIENHVDQSAPIVIERDGILPSLLSRPPVVERAAFIRAVFIVEPDEAAVLENMLELGHAVAGWTQKELENEARAKWLVLEAARYDMPVIEPRPWETLAERLIDNAA